MTLSPRRYKFAQGLSEPYLSLYYKLCDILPDRWEPYQGYRSEAQQATLYSQGRDSGGRIIGGKGKVVTNAAPWDSAHCWGAATDWIVFEDNRPKWDLSPDDWIEYSNAIAQIPGLEWGGTWAAFQDKPHNELALKCRWRDVGGVYRAAGLDLAKEYLLDNVKA